MPSAATRVALVVACAALTWCSEPSVGNSEPDANLDTARITLFALTSGTPQASIPVTVVADWRVPDAGAVGCVALTASPGSIAFPLPSLCGGDASTGDASSPSTSCLSFTDPSPIEGAWTATAIAAYTATGHESAMTVYGALYATMDCSGDPIATTALVSRLVNAADASTDASSDGAPDAASEAMTDSSVDASSDAAGG